MTRILLLDDYQIVGQGMKNIIEFHSDFRVPYVSEQKAALELSEKEPFDFTI